MSPTYAPAEPSNLSKSQIAALAEQVAAQLGFKPGDDIHALVARMGGAVEVQDTLTEDPERSGSLYVEGPDRFRIIVPSHTSMLRDNFTIAHELGHFVVHYLLRRRQRNEDLPPMVALRKGSDRIEWEANWFAAAFLMPQAAFEQAFAESGDLDTVAETFFVSPTAAEVRARQLALIG